MRLDPFKRRALRKPDVWLTSAIVDAVSSAHPRGPSVGFAATSPCFRMGRTRGAAFHLPYREAMGEYPGGGRGPTGFSRAENAALTEAFARG
jgi:hypothetical protein